MDVNWRWHSRYRGLLPLSPQALADDGRLLFVRPDELEARKYQVLQADASGTVVESCSLTVETVRQMVLTVEAPVLLGTTDDDLYLFREGRKSRFLQERRVSYLDVALARSGGLFAAAFTDMLFAGQTLCLGDTGGKVIWTKDLDAPISVVAIAPDGRTVAAGLENGRLLAFDAGRSLLWEAVLDEAPVALALAQGGTRCAVATAGGVVLAIDGGDVAWRVDAGLGASWTPEAVALACDGRGRWVAVAAGDDAQGWVLLLDAEGRPAWEHATGSRPTGVALSPDGGWLAVSQADGELLAFTVEGEEAGGLSAEAAEGEFRRALAARDAGRAPEAREALLRVLEADPGHLAACEALIALDDTTRVQALSEADRLLVEARFTEALQALDAARAILPADHELPQRWSAVLAAAAAHAAGEAARAEAVGDPEAAATHWRSLLRLDPKHRHARQEVARLGRLVADRLVCEGEAALAAGREEEALATWRRAQATAPSETLAQRLREVEVRRYVRHGVELYGQQRFPEAAFQFRKALAVHPDHPEALRYLAYISGAGPQSPLSERFSRLE